MPSEIKVLVRDIGDLRSKLLEVATRKKEAYEGELDKKKEIRDIKAMLKEKLQIYDLIKQSDEIIQQK